MDVVIMATLPCTAYMSQSDKGEMVIGGGTKWDNKLTPNRGHSIHIEETCARLGGTFPNGICGSKVLRQWGGIVDGHGGRSPILSEKRRWRAYLGTAAGGTGGLKDQSQDSGWAMAELMAKGRSP